MEKYVIWIVAVLGAGTLLGVFWKMKGGFGPINLRVVGIVLIAALVCLLSLAKSSDITAAMGILGAIAGYLFGATRATDAEEAKSSSSVDASGARFGNDARVAGRDINEMIENLQGDIKEIKDSVINQVTDSGLSEDSVTEFLFFTSFLSDGEPINESAKVIRNFQPHGWSLFSTAGSYAGGNGLVLVFRRLRPPTQRDRRSSEGYYPARIYHGIDEVEMDYE